MHEQPRPRRLTRSGGSRLGGVCGGIGDYFGVDPTIVCIAFILFAVFSAGFGAVLLYGVLWAIMPEADPDAPPAPPADPANRPMLLGIALVVLGAALLFQRLPMFWWMTWGMGSLSWPLLLVAGGLIILITARRR